MNNDSFEILLTLALEEDLRDQGDITSRAIFSDEKCIAVLVSNDSGILAGTEYFIRVCRKVDPEISVKFLFNDGDRLEKGDIAAEVYGKTLSILTAERTALNFIAYLSGIASITNEFVRNAAEIGNTVILDTRKTLPGYRSLAKAAVRAGGGTNHRMGLYDMVMIKDNHIDASGSITAAVERIKSKYGAKYKIETECRTIAEVKEAIDAGTDIIMLDNMEPETVKQAVKLRSGEVRFESSGDMDLEKIGRYAGLGVDFLSVGRLTHSVVSFNFSLRIKPDTKG